MIKTIIFDFGDVFINLDKEATERMLFQFGVTKISPEMMCLTKQYELGLITTANFIKLFKTLIPKISKEKIIESWNSILLDFPKYRLEFLKNLSKEKKYKLILLSNTNELHISWIKNHIPFYEEFKNCFDAFYLSNEINLRKPDFEIFKFVLSENNLIAEECLFIDDTKEHIDSAYQLVINTWHLNTITEDVIDLFKIKKEFFTN